MALFQLLLMGLMAHLTRAILPPNAYRHFKRQIEIGVVNWSSIEPSQDLVYSDCLDGFKCARLLAPLDWSKHGNSPCGLGNLDTNNSVALAIITLPASVPETDPSFGGSVLWNPGGPGGPATISAEVNSPYYQTMLDGSKHYEIVAFDPRGVGESTPQIKCFDRPWQRAMAESKTAEAISPRHGRAALATQFEQHAAIGEICLEAGPDSIHAHAGTASVARDMLHIVDKMEEERISRHGGAYVPAYDKPRLQYIGISYGTTLGSYFASMFPGRVGRMFLSAIVDPEAYRHGKAYDLLSDAEAAIDYIYEACFETSCPFSNASDTGPKDIKARVQAALDWLDGTPVVKIVNQQIFVVRSVVLRRWLYWISYGWAEYMLDPIASIVAGDLSGVGTFFSSSDFDESSPDIPYSWVGDSSSVISCLDMHARKADMDVDWAYERYKAMEAEAPTAVDFRYTLPMPCARWTLAPAYDFQEPFGAPPPDPDLAPDAPAAPIFMISTRFDPTTPLASAWAVSRLYPNSSVMILDTAGHDTFGRADGCVFDAVRAYFEDGVVPPNGTTCEALPITAGEQPGMFRALL